jgi:hypothetical protein
MFISRLIRGSYRLAVIAVFALSTAQAQLRYAINTTSDGYRFVLISGLFLHEDRLEELKRLLRNYNPVFVTFDSPGGNVAKAMEVGRLLREFQVSTLQPRALDCASACALAFLGGVGRYAEPGAIGVHRSSFAATHRIDAEVAVAAVQLMTAEIMSYMAEMGANPTLLQLALKYGSNDIRYLSAGEMSDYGVTTMRTPEGALAIARRDSGQPAVPKASTPPPSLISRAPDTFEMPIARSGRIRHPSGFASLKSRPDTGAADFGIVPNGTPVTILDNTNRWFCVVTSARGGTLNGYMHHTWIYVDQFENGPFENRHIQIKSFQRLQEAKDFISGSSMPLSAYLATNGWIAVTLGETYTPQEAIRLTELLKQRGSIPNDSFVTYGNTYVRKLCCK